MVKRVAMGVVGCGVVATQHILPNLVHPEIAQKGIELVGVCDIVESRAREAMKAFGAKDMYTDYREMLDNPDINIVAVLTPISSHYHIAIASALAAKNIYVQKTMTTTLEEADSLLSTVRRKGVKLVASPGQMHNPSLRMTKEMLDKGLIGRPLWGHIFANNDGHINEITDPTWYYKPGGGPVYSFLVYLVTTFCWLLGSVRRVTSFSDIAIATRRWNDKEINCETDDSTMILLDFGNSVLVSAISNFCVKKPVVDGVLYGTKGVARIPLCVLRSTQQTARRVFFSNSIRKIKEWVQSLRSSENEWVEWVPPLFSYPVPLAARRGANILADILELVDCVKYDRDPTIATGERARHVIEVFEKAYRAAETGQHQSLQTTFD